MESPLLIAPPAPDADELAYTVSRAQGVSRREALRRVSVYGLALAASPMALAALAREAHAQTLPQGIIDVLRFALTLEFLEAEFYEQGLAAGGLIVASDLPVFQTIAQHERDHVEFLQGVLGLSGTGGRPANGFDFTAGGSFDTFTNYQTFLVLSQGFEDTGVRAYKGGAAALMSNDTVLTAALQIHSVEARHASVVRRIRGERGYITQDQVDAPTNTIQNVYRAGDPAATYPSEANTTQGGVTIQPTAEYNANQITEAFDEPLDVASVLQIANPFIVD
jgi:hypothetical protein